MQNRSRSQEDEMEAAGKNLGSDVLKGAVAGAIGVVAMDYLVTKPMYRTEDPVAHLQEKRAQVGGRYVAFAALDKIKRRFGLQLTERQDFVAGKAIHYLLGIAPAVAYVTLRRKAPWIRSGRGLLYGLSLFILNDEIAGPALGIASGPTKYPWQAHARGLAGHLMLGAATEVTIEAMDKAA